MIGLVFGMLVVVVIDGVIVVNGGVIGVMLRCRHKILLMLMLLCRVSAC